MLKFDLNLLWTVINLVVFFILMKVFLFKPIKKTLDKRKAMIDQQFSNADAAQKQADELKEQYQGQLSGVEDEKKQILNDARANAKAEYNKIIDRAQADADKIKSDAKKHRISNAKKQEAQSTNKLPLWLWKPLKRLSAKMSAPKQTASSITNF